MDIQIFEQTKSINEYEQEVWYARQFAKTLEYEEYDDFEEVIKKAMIACKNSGHNIQDHFGGTMEKVINDEGEEELLPSYQLSRYACYLIVLNADPSKAIVAVGQSYFARQTRRQEMNDQKSLKDQGEEDQRRIVARDEMKEHNKNLASVAKRAGVVNYGRFTDAGYKGLYGGRQKRDIVKTKGLDENDNILDFMSSEELGANLFRATQTEAKIKRKLHEGKKTGQEVAEKTHFEVGQKVRDTIKELGGTMPENLPKVEHIKHARKRLKELSYDIPHSHITYTPTHYFDLPEDLETMEELVLILQEHKGKGDYLIKFGEILYQIDGVGLQKIKELCADGSTL